MSKESKSAVDTLIDCIIRAANDAVKGARFDKTFFGIVTDAETTPGSYIVSADGKNYTVKSTQHFDVYERVAITAPQSDFSNLIIRKL